MSLEATLNDALKELNEEYDKEILFLERSRQYELQKAMNEINNRTAKCRKKIEEDYRKHRETIKQKLFIVKMQCYAEDASVINETNNAKTKSSKSPSNVDILNKAKHVQSKQSNKQKEINRVKRKHKEAIKNDVIIVADDSGSDCVVIEPPNKRHKSNNHDIIATDNDQNRNEWNCHECTFLNKHNRKRCLMCQAKRKMMNKKKVKKQNKRIIVKPGRGKFDSSEEEEEESFSEYNPFSDDDYNYNQKSLKLNTNRIKSNKRNRRRKQHRIENETDTDSDHNKNTNSLKKTSCKPRKQRLSSKSNKREKTQKPQRLNSYFRGKQTQILKAQEKLKHFARDNNGKYIIQLPINTICTEYPANTVFVTDFGNIPNNKSKAAKYCTADYIYPIGFKAVRIHTSYKDPRTKTKYFMEVLDNGYKGPKYKVYAEDDKNNEMTHTALTTPWQNIINSISDKAKELNCAGCRETSATSGPRWLGLRDYLIMGIIELLPNARKCKTYWQSKNTHDLPPKPFFPHLSANDIVIK